MNRIIAKDLMNATTVTGFEDALYFIGTDSRGQRDDNAYRMWKNELKKVTRQTCENYQRSRLSNMCALLPNSLNVASAGAMSKLARKMWLRPYARKILRNFSGSCLKHGP